MQCDRNISSSWHRTSGTLRLNDLQSSCRMGILGRKASQPAWALCSLLRVYRLRYWRLLRCGAVVVLSRSEELGSRFVKRHDE
jgi:hypothetical protein